MHRMALTNVSVSTINNEIIVEDKIAVAEVSTPDLHTAHDVGPLCTAKRVVYTNTHTYTIWINVQK